MTTFFSKYYRFHTAAALFWSCGHLCRRWAMAAVVALAAIIMPAWSLYGQILDRKIYDYEYKSERDKRSYDRYNMDRLSGEADGTTTLSPEYGDTTKPAGKIAVSPEELRKLGVTEDVIDQLMLLNEEQDSLKTAKKLYEKKEKDKKRKEGLQKAFETGDPYLDPDSLTVDDLQKLIDFEKEKIIKRALSLPPPYVYGHEFFRRSNLKILNSPDVKERVADDYILAEGDEITIVMWGNIDYSQIFAIDAQGGISPPLVGRMYLRGSTYKAARDLIKQKFAKAYALEGNTIEVSVSFLRSISVNFVGELFHPGTYRFSAITSVFNALAAIAGPGQLGSVRNIYIKRGGQTIKTLDMYQYLNDPQSNQDFFLQNNDYVLVPTLGPVVHISGEVRRPYNYELKGEEGLQDLIKYAGGLRGNAFTRNINIKRYKNSRETLLSVNLDSLNQFHRDFAIENGDSIFIFAVPNTMRNFVQVTGAVLLPGRYEVRKGERISQILAKAQGVSEDADLTRGYVIRLQDDRSKIILPFNPENALKNPKSTDNLVLSNLDTLQILSGNEFRQDFMVDVKGAVVKEGQYQFAGGLTLKDILYLAGGLRREAANNRVEVSRVVTFSDQQTGEKGVERVIVKRAEIQPDLSIEKSAEEFVIQPYDQIFVRTAPLFEKPQTVKLYGEIVYPGEYALLNKNERLTSLIERAGGLNPAAFRDGCRFYRYNDSLGYVLMDIPRGLFEEINRGLKGKKRRKAQEERERLEKYNYILFENDSIFIPKIRNTVTLAGAMQLFDVDTLTRISVPYEANQDAEYYIENYGGGFSRFAKKRRTFVQDANGHIHATQRGFWGKRHYPKVENGATVFVDIKDNRRRYLQEQQLPLSKREKRDWNKAFDSVAAKISTVLTLLLLITQVTR